jgi:nucleoside triphosphate pyrophosphatase
MRLVLASRSPRRAELLTAAGFRFETLAVDVDERVRGAEPPADYVRRLASEKSARVFDLLQADGKRHGTADVVVLGADTAVVVGGVILGKPLDDADAAQMLRRLAGRTHEVLTAVSLRAAGGERSDVTTTAVEVAALSDEDIAWYVASGEGRDKAGAYAIQGLAARFIPRIEGSYSNVVGLPIATVHALVAEIALRPLSRLS